MNNKKKKPEIYLRNKDLLAEIIVSKEAGKMSDLLATMFMKLVQRYSERHNFANYTYIEDMRGYALMELMRSWSSFKPEVSNNPFAFFTQCIRNSFIQYLNKEKKQRDIRDTILVHSGLTPSFNYQLEQEAKSKNIDDEEDWNQQQKTKL